MAYPERRGGGHHRKAAVAAASQPANAMRSAAAYGAAGSWHAQNGSGSSGPSRWNAGASSVSAGGANGSVVATNGAGRFHRSRVGSGNDFTQGGTGSAPLWQSYQKPYEAAADSGGTSASSHAGWNGGRSGPRGNGGYGAWHGGPVVVPPPPQAPAAPVGLRDLLAQVAPHARIFENTSQLSSKSSANILSKVLAQTSSGNPDETQGDHPQQQTANHYYNYYNNDADYFNEMSGAYGQGGNYDGEHATAEDDDKFMENWQGLFSKGSPLVDGSATDPFKDLKDMKAREKITWKKNRDRKGHRTRYQERKHLREYGATSEDTGAASASGQAQDNADLLEYGAASESTGAASASGQAQDNSDLREYGATSESTGAASASGQAQDNSDLREYGATSETTGAASASGQAQDNYDPVVDSAHGAAASEVSSPDVPDAGLVSTVANSDDVAGAVSTKDEE